MNIGNFGLVLCHGPGTTHPAYLVCLGLYSMFRSGNRQALFSVERQYSKNILRTNGHSRVSEQEKTSRFRSRKA